MRLIDEPSEQFPTFLFEPFWVPLHTENRLVLGAFHRLDGAVGCLRRNAEAVAHVIDGLMVECIDKNRRFFRIRSLFGGVNLGQFAVGLDDDRVRRFRPMTFLRMFDGRRGGNVLRDVAAEGHRQRLHTPTNAENRNLTVVGKARQQQFRQVAPRIDATEFRRRLFAAPKRIVVGSTAEQKAVDVLQHIDENPFVGSRRNYHGRSACLNDLFVVGVTKGSISIRVVARDADERAVVGGRKVLVNRLQIRF